MKQGTTLFLRIVICLIAIATLAGLVRFPQTEGRAANLDLISIYADPFIIYMYIASISFFIGLYQAFKLLQFIDANRAFSQGAINALRNIRFASIVLICFIVLGLFYIRFFAHGDDPAGPTMLGIIVSFIVAVIATVAAVFQKILKHGVELSLKLYGRSQRHNE